MLLGRENLQPVDLIPVITATDASEEDMTPHEYIKQIRNTIHEVHFVGQGKKTLKEHKKTQKRNYDPNSNQNTFN